MPNATQVVIGRPGILTPEVWLHCYLDQQKEKAGEPDGALERAFIKEDGARLRFSKSTKARVR